MYIYRQKLIKSHKMISLTIEIFSSLFRLVYFYRFNYIIYYYHLYIAMSQFPATRIASSLLSADFGKLGADAQFILEQGMDLSLLYLFFVKNFEDNNKKYCI